MRIIDSHVHLENHNPEKMREMADRFGYEKYAVMCTPCEGNALNTLEGLLAKSLTPQRTYVFGGMVYAPGRAADGKDHEKQLELMLDAGCDGWKLLESKPSTYRALKTPLDGDVFDGDWNRLSAVVQSLAEKSDTANAGDSIDKSRNM